MGLNQNKISILIPAFNEEENILLTIKETINVFDSLGKDYEIVIIDDGSYDDTYQIVKKELGCFNGRVKIEKCLSHQGKGFAIKYGFSFINGDYVLFLDADLDLPPFQIANFLKLMKENNADIVLGSKRHRNSVVEYPFTRKVCSIVYYYLTKLLFRLPVKDTQTGFKLFKYNALKTGIEKVIVKKYAFDLELLVVLNKYKYKIIEGPIYLKQTRKYGRIRISDIFYIFWDTLGVFYRLYIKRYYDDRNFN